MAMNPFVVPGEVVDTMVRELSLALMKEAGIMLLPERMRDVASAAAEVAVRLQRQETAPLAKKLFDTERVLNEAALALGFEQGRTLGDVPKAIHALLAEQDDLRARSAEPEKSGAPVEPAA